jgi:hypothetical protein
VLRFTTSLVTSLAPAPDLFALGLWPNRVSSPRFADPRAFCATAATFHNNIIAANPVLVRRTQPSVWKHLIKTSLTPFAYSTRTR